jgi:peptidoglycan/LPS O-acetylase OafA/YrhL
MKYVREFEGLRGLLAVWVVLGHALASLPQAYAFVSPSIWNQNAVDVFMILSGFVIFSMLEQRSGSYGAYISSRALRLFPVYLVALLLAASTLSFAKESLMGQSPFGFVTAARIACIEAAQSRFFEHVAIHIPLLQGVLPSSALPWGDVSLLGPAWSLSVEWQFYLLAPLLFRGLSSLRKTSSKVSVIVIYSLLLGAGHFMTGAFFGNNLVTFSTGFISFFFYRYALERVSDNQLNALTGLAALVAFVFFRSHLVGILIWLAVFHTVCAQRIGARGSVLSRVLLSGVTQYLGRISYPLYLIHMVVLFGCIWLTNKHFVSLGVMYLALPLGCLTLSIACADLLHRTVESPFHRIGKAIARSSANRIPNPSRIVTE